MRAGPGWRRQRPSSLLLLLRKAKAEQPSSFALLFDELSLSSPHIHHIHNAMDAFTIASPVPVDEPTVEVFVDQEKGSGTGGHSGCVIA